jgi:prolyl-tRNA synthetase
MGCYYQTEEGKREPVIMGSYGIGVGRLLACVAEEYADDSGMRLPVTIAPYQVHLVSLVKDEEIPDGLYQQLLAEGIEVLFDDRKGSAGVKFNDADLIGIPIRITLGNRGLKENSAEVTVASEPEKRMIRLDSIVAEIKSIISSRISEIYDRIERKSL